MAHDSNKNYLEKVLINSIWNALSVIFCIFTITSLTFLVCFLWFLIGVGVISFLVLLNTIPKMACLNTIEIYFLKVWEARRLKWRYRLARGLSENCRGESFLAYPALQWCLAVSSIPWLAVASPQSLLVLLYSVFPSPKLISSSKDPSYSIWSSPCFNMISTYFHDICKDPIFK